MTTLPPTGWYPDPEQPGMLRFWDGTAWTEHRAPDYLPASPRRIGDWLGLSFSTAWRCVVPLLALAALLVVVPAVPFALTLHSLLGEVVVDGGRFDGLNDSAVIPTVAAGAGMVVGLVVFAVAASHQLVYAQRGHRVSWTRSLAVGLGRAAQTTALLVALTLLPVVVFVVGVASPTAGVSLLMILAALALGAAVVVAGVFVPVAAATSPQGTRLLVGSAGVAKGRVGAIIGRLLLLSLVSLLVTLAGSLVVSPITAAVGGLDPNDIQLADDGTIESVVMDELLPGANGFALYIAVSSLVQAVGMAVWFAGLAVIYLDVRAPLRPEP